MDDSISATTRKNRDSRENRDSRVKNSGRVLVVDDDETIRTLCAEVISVAGFKVVTARDGKDAMEVLGGSPFDLVLTDVDMPGLDGVSLYLYAMREHPHLKGKFLFMTGNPSEEFGATARRLGVAHLAKPFRIAELTGAVKRKVREVERRGRLAEVFTVRRREDRTRWVGRCEVFEGGRVLAARTENLSRNGVKVRFSGGPFMDKAEVKVRLDMDFVSLNLSRRGHVVWSRRLDDGRAEAGVSFTEPMPLSSLPILMHA